MTQEAEISITSPTLKNYKSAIHHAAVSISRRPPPDTVDHPSVGTVKESREAHDRVAKENAGRLERVRIEGYCTPVDQLLEWGYPDYNDGSLCDGDTEPSAEGTTQVCDRCKVNFVVSAQHLDERMGECRFHTSRPLPERVEGRRKWLHPCCGRERGGAGCTEGIHVFSEKEDDAKLARRHLFRRVKDVAGSHIGVVSIGLDCEMICEYYRFEFTSV